jgi:hypothetical protein
MNKVTRHRVFETNSSSTHSLCLECEDVERFMALTVRLATALEAAVTQLEGRQMELPTDAKVVLAEYRALCAELC